MDNKPNTFSLRSIFGIVGLAAVALAAVRRLLEIVITLAPLDSVEIGIDCCVVHACSFGIAGIIVGWPLRGILVGTAIGLLVFRLSSIALGFLTIM